MRPQRLNDIVLCIAGICVSLIAAAGCVSFLQLVLGAPLQMPVQAVLVAGGVGAVLGTWDLLRKPKPAERGRTSSAQMQSHAAPTEMLRESPERARQATPLRSQPPIGTTAPIQPPPNLIEQVDLTKFLSSVAADEYQCAKCGNFAGTTNGHPFCASCGASQMTGPQRVVLRTRLETSHGI